VSVIMPIEVTDGQNSTILTRKSTALAPSFNDLTGHRIK